jgi:hypothetical protein
VKNYFLIFFGVCAIFVSFLVQAEEIIQSDTMEEKFYVTPGSVYVAPDAIYVIINGEFMAVETISVDSHGVYFKPYEAFKVVYCARCGKQKLPGHVCDDLKKKK